MSRKQKAEEWMNEVDSRQRSTLFPDNLRNRTRFWQGIYQQELSVVQTIGFVILVMFYVIALILTFLRTWPAGEGPFLEKLMNAYGLQVIICLPAFLLLWFLLRRTTRKR